MRARFCTCFYALVVSGLLVSSEASSSEPDRIELPPGPGRLLPDVGPNTPGLIDTLADGTRRLIVNGMRILDYPDGSVERAREIFPAVTVRTPVALPARLGGGVLFAVVVGDGTQIWRAKSWMGDLQALTAIPVKVGDIVPGFDRIYLGVPGGQRAIDAVTGFPRSIQPLPGGTTIGQYAFADAWRAVAVADYRGALATFDAGNTWRPIPLEGSVQQVSVRDGSFVLDTPGKRFLLGTSGEVVLDESSAFGIGVSRDRQASAAPTTVVPSPESSLRRGLGRRALRAAIEGGWPVRGSRGEQTAVFAQGGSLYRVALQRMDADHATGAILEARPGAFRAEDDSCHAVPLGQDFGFVCDSPAGGSTIYAFERPFAMREIARFVEHPRSITSSGNGALVVGGSCARNEWGLGDPSAFCFFFPSGEEREVTLPNLTIAERSGLRPVGLRDGRALFIVQPSDRSSGSLLISQGHDFVRVPLQIGERALWLKKAMIEGGVEEREPGVLGGWAIAGNDLRGLRIGVDGKVTLGADVTSSLRTVVSGRYAFDWGTTARGKETIDGGMSWSVVDLSPSLLDGSTLASAACGPVGASEGVTRDGKPSSWLRIGWGSVLEAPDLLSAPPPRPSAFKLPEPRGVSLRCEPTGEVAGPAPKPPPPKKPAPAAKKLAVPKITLLPSGANPPTLLPPRGLPPIFNPGNMAKTPPVSPEVPALANLWSAFRGLAPPALRREEKGLEAGTDTTQVRIYVWGTKGADWLRNGHLQVRFDDRFDLAGTRTTAVTPALWSDEEKAADALGLIAQQPVTWSALLEVSGQAAVIVGQRPGRTDLYGAAQGEPVVAWRDVAGAPLVAPLAFPGSVVRIGSTWFYLGSTPGQGSSALTIYRVDGGVVRRFARLPRVSSPGDASFPRLTRRARGRGLALIIRGVLGLDQAMRDWYVLPINEESGELDEPVRLYASYLEHSIPARCAADEYGWLVMPEFGLPPHLDVIPPLVANLGFVEARIRLEPGKACIESLASRSEGLVSPSSAPRPLPVFDSDAAIPLTATDSSSGRRWLLRCGQ